MNDIRKLAAPIWRRGLGDSTALDISNLKVLVLDDNAFSREINCAALKAMNIQRIATAHSVGDAMAAVETIAPDLMLVDWVMEPENGLSFVRTMRSGLIPSARYTPIILVSGYSELWRVHMARDAGVNEYIVKPFTAKTLYAKIRSIVEINRPFVEVPGGYFGPDRRRRDLDTDIERRGVARISPDSWHSSTSDGVRQSVA